jgi:hypothetical protein
MEFQKSPRQIVAEGIMSNTPRRATPTNLVITLTNTANGATDEVVSLLDANGFNGSSHANDALISVATEGGIQALRNYLKQHNIIVTGFTYASSTKNQLSAPFSHKLADFNGKKDAVTPLNDAIASARKPGNLDQTILEVPFSMVLHADMDLELTVLAGEVVTINFNIAEVTRAY